jgi:hypothetical protein
MLPNVAAVIRIAAKRDILYLTVGLSARRATSDAGRSQCQKLTVLPPEIPPVAERKQIDFTWQGGQGRAFGGDGE